MPQSNNLHSADGSFLGFFFQIERTIYWLSMLNADGMVGVEVDDDIVIQLSSGKEIKKIYEQAKNTQLKNKFPFSNKSEDLWKTLSIWVNSVKNDGLDPENSIFSAISNKKLPKDRLLYALSEASKADEETLKKICADLKQTASSLRKDLLRYGEVIRDCDDILLCSIIDKIKVLDVDYSHDLQFKKTIKNNLRISADLPFDYIYSGLFGYVSDYLIDCWKQKKAAWISVESFLNRYTSLIAEFKNKKFIEKATSLLPVSNEEIKANRNKVYVEQLLAVGCDETEILESIEHYLRAASEKSRYAKEGDISNDAFTKYYEDLIDNWKSISRPRFRACKTDTTKHTNVGYEVLYETMRYRGKLSGQEPEQSYTHKGAYHFLSNNVELGWHPEWAKKFKR